MTERIKELLAMDNDALCRILHKLGSPMYAGPVELWAFRARNMIEDAVAWGDAAWAVKMSVMPPDDSNDEYFPEFVLGYCWLGCNEATPKHWIIAAIVALEAKQ